MNMNRNQLNVYYKYAAPMNVVIKSAPAFKQSIIEKYIDFINLKTELHVSPFFTYSNEFYYQPIFDFDGLGSYMEAKEFCLVELVREKEDLKNWFVEFTGKSFHITNHHCYGPFKKEHIKQLRDYLKTKLGKHYSSLDISSSIRHLPIRRSLSRSSTYSFMVLPVKIKTFLNKSHTRILEDLKEISLSELEFSSILENYVLPIKILNVNEAPFYLHRSLIKE